MMEVSKEIILSFGDTQITGKNCVVESAQVNITNNDMECYRLGGKKPVIVSTQKEITIDLTLRCTDIGYESLLSGSFTPKLRNKKVDDCSISELLFAIRKKVSERK